MVVHINVLSSGVEDGILRKLDVAKVVAVDRRRIGHLLLQILKEPLQPNGCACGDNRSSVLSFVARQCNCRLLLTAPRDRNTLDGERVSRCGSAIGGVASPISIGVADQLRGCTGPI